MSDKNTLFNIIRNSLFGKATKQLRKARFMPRLEQCEERVVPATVVWNDTTKELTVTAVSGGETITITSNNPDGKTYAFVNGETTAALASEVKTLTLVGDAGKDTFDLTGVTVAAFSDSAFAVSIDGNGDTDTLTINTSDARSWDIGKTGSSTYANDSGTVQIGGKTVTFVETESLTGGSGNDTFTFNVNGSTAYYVTGTITGGSGTNTADFSAYGAAITVTTTGVDDGNISITGPASLSFVDVGYFSGTTVADTFIIGSNGTTVYQLSSINGNDGDDTINLSAITSAATITINGDGNGTFSDSLTTSITSVQRIVGTAANDTFNIDSDNNGSLLFLDGYNGVDTLSYASRNGPVFVNLQSTSATGITTIANLETYTGSTASTSDTFTGDDITNSWFFSSATAGTLNTTTSFSAFETINGGSDIDTFTLAADINFSGSLDGEGGLDELNFSAHTAARTVTLTSMGGINGFNGTSTDVLTGSFLNIDAIRATSQVGDTIVGLDAANVWNIDSTDSTLVQYTSTNTLNLYDFNDLTGGIAADTFSVYRDHTGTLTGGAGANSFNFSNTSTLTGSIVGGSDSDTLSFSDFTTGTTITAALSSNAAAGYTGTITTYISGTFSAVDTLIGSDSTSNTLTGLNATATFDIDGTNTYTSSTFILNFSGFYNLNGGSGDDTFNVSDNHTGNLDGKNGTNAFNLTSTAQLTGNITGGSGADTVSIAGTSKITGNVDLTSGTDVLTYTSYSSFVSTTLSGVTANGFTIAAAGTTAISGTVAGINTLVGSSSTDSLTGYNAAATWTVASGDDTYTTTASLTVSAFENFIGNADVDTFNITGAHSGNLSGMAGADVFNVGATLTGSISGGADSDTINMNASSSVTGTVDGGADSADKLDYSSTDSGTAILINRALGTATNTGGFSGIENVVGNSNTGNTLTGANTTATWTITSSNSGNIGGTGVFDFSSFPNLVGGVYVDTFNFSTTNTITGSINGGGGLDIINRSGATANLALNITGTNAGNFTSGFTFTSVENLTTGTGADTITFSAAASIAGSLNATSGADKIVYSYTSPVSVNLQTTTATGIGTTWSNIDEFTGGSGSDTLVGANTANTWTLTGANAGTVTGGYTFSSFENLTGGTADDTFAIGNQSLTGRIVGGGGTTNTVSYAGRSSAVTVNLSVSSATDTGGFSGINTLIGGSATTDTLVGANTATTWTISGTNAGSLNTPALTFSAIENLTGGSGIDTFTFQDGMYVDGTINGGTGVDVLNYSAYTSSNRLSLNVTSNNLGTVASAAFTGTKNFTAVESITGSAGDDVFVLANLRGLSGTLNGSGGTDALDYSAYTSSVSVTLNGSTSSTATNISSGISNIEMVYGGSGNDSLTGSIGNDILVGNGGNDTLTGNGGDDLLIGGAGSDTINGGAGQDIVIGGASTRSTTQLISDLSTWATSHTPSSLSDLSGSVTDTESDTLTGGSDTDWFILSILDRLTDLATGETRSYK